MSSVKKGDVTLFEKIGYSLGDGSANLIFQMMMMFQLTFYTDVFGIKASTAGMILLLARFTDAFVDPMIGIWSDRTNTKWGKYRPWVLWTAIPLAVFFVLAFLTPDLNERGRVIYAGVTYTLLMAVYSFNNIPYSSLGGVMTSDIRQRTSINSIRFVSATVATFVVQGLTLPLVAKFGNGDTQHGWFVTITIFAVAVALLLFITFLTSRERITPPENQQTSVKQDFKDVFASVPWRAMFATTLFLFITLAMWGSAMNYYFRYFVDAQALGEFLDGWGLSAIASGDTGLWYKTLDAFGLIVQSDYSNASAVGFGLFNMIGQFLTIFVVLFGSGSLSGIYGNKPVFIFSMIGTTIFTALFFMVSADQIALMFWINVGKNLFYALSIPLLWTMMADVADHSEWVNHRRATGFVFAGIVFALKAGLGIGAALCGAILGGFGFVANVAQSDASILGIRLTASVIPACLFFACACALMFFPISKKFNEQIQADLRERRAKNNY